MPGNKRGKAQLNSEVYRNIAVAPRTTRATKTKMGSQFANTLTQTKSVKKMFEKQETNSLDGLALTSQAKTDAISHDSAFKTYPVTCQKDKNMQEERETNQPKQRPYYPYKQETRDRCITTQSQGNETLMNQRMEKLSIQDDQSFNTTTHQIQRSSMKAKERHHKVKSSAQ